MKMITAFLVCGLIAVNALTDEQKTKIKGYSTECISSSGVDRSEIENARKGTLSEDDKFKEYLFCLSKHIGFQDESGHLQTDVLKEKATAELKDSSMVDSFIEKCAVQKDTPQQTAYETVKCYTEFASANDMIFVA